MKNSILLLLFITLFGPIVLNAAQAREELVINSEDAFIPTHHNRFSFMLGINPSMQKASDVTNFTFSYAKKMDDYWLDTNLLYTSGLFDKLSTNNPAATTLSSDLLTDTKSTHISVGVGIGRETSYTQSLVPLADIYELMAANLTYNSFKEPTSSKSFTGPGMIAKFLVYKKFSNYFTAGTQFTYNLAVVKRGQDFETESSSARSLTISYLTIGFDLSFYL